MIAADFMVTIHAFMLSSGPGLPLLLAFGCALPFKHNLIARMLPLAALPALYCSFAVPRDMVVEVPWFFMGGKMGLDAVSQVFLCVSAFIWLLAALAWGPRHRRETGGSRFIVFFLAAMAGNFGLILAQDMLGFYLFFALMSFSAFGLIIFHNTEEEKQAGRIYLIMVIIGEVAMFTGMVFLAEQIQSIAFADIGKTPLPFFILVLFYIGFGVKIGAFPFHIWMPGAYQAVPAPAGAALAGAMVNAGILGWLRFLPLGRESLPESALLFIVGGIFSALYGVIIGLGQKRPKTILAYSSISQMGLMTIIVGLGLLTAELGKPAITVLTLYAVHHALAKCSLFLGLPDETDALKQISGWQIFAMLLPVLALAGLPFTSGAVVKTAFKELAAATGTEWREILHYFLPVSSFGTTILMLHFIRLLNRCNSQHTPFNFKQRIPWIISLTAVATVIWLWPPAHNAAHHSLTLSKIWQSLWPVAAGCIPVFIWTRVAGDRDTPYTIPAGDVLVLFKNSIRLVRQLCDDIMIEKQVKPQAGEPPTLSGIIGFLPDLRKNEKVMGRWTVVGFCYLALFGILFFLLL